MKIIPIFAPRLFSFKFDENEDELSRLFDFWTDPEQLFEYFEANNDVLEYENISIEEGILQTIENAEQLYDLLRQNLENLDSLFEHLSVNQVSYKLLIKHKSKRKWLRLYAIKIESNYFIITGGAIKQSQKMEDNPYTREELVKLEKCRDYLIENGVFDSDSFFDFYEMEF